MKIVVASLIAKTLPVDREEGIVVEGIGTLPGVGQRNRDGQRDVHPRHVVVPSVEIFFARRGRGARIAGVDRLLIRAEHGRYDLLVADVGEFFEIGMAVLQVAHCPDQRGSAEPTVARRDVARCGVGRDDGGCTPTESAASPRSESSAPAGARRTAPRTAARIPSFTGDPLVRCPARERTRQEEEDCEMRQTRGTHGGPMVRAASSKEWLVIFPGQGRADA